MTVCAIRHHNQAPEIRQCADHAERRQAMPRVDLHTNCTQANNPSLLRERFQGFTEKETLELPFNFFVCLRVCDFRNLLAGLTKFHADRNRHLSLYAVVSVSPSTFTFAFCRDHQLTQHWFQILTLFFRETTSAAREKKNTKGTEVQIES